MTPQQEAHHEYLKGLMHSHRELIKQYHRLRDEFGSAHVGVKRTILLIQITEERLYCYIPKNAIQRFCERL